MDTKTIRTWGTMLALCFALFALSTGCPAPTPPVEETKTETKAEPKAEAKAEPATEPKAEPAVEPAVEPTVEPALEPTVEPAVEPAVEPKDEPATEPKDEPVAEPTNEPTPEDGGGEATPDNTPEVTTETAPDVNPDTPPGPKDETLAVVLSGSQEVPSVTTANNGTATVKINAARTEIDVTLIVQGIVSTDIVGAHIHYGKPGQTGPVLFVLSAASMTSPLAKNLKAADLTTAAAVGINNFADAIKALLEGRCYINVHSKAVASGEIRGQIGQASLKVILSGSQEVPRSGSTASGDATVTINAAQDEITVDINHTGLTAITGAHIHLGLPGESGPVFFGLSSGTIASPFQIKLKAAELQQLATQGINNFADAVNALLSGHGYINIHTTANPGGELRGQIGQAQLRVTLSGAQESPAVATTGTGDAWVFINGDHTNLHATLNTTNVTDIQSAHIHVGLPGVSGPVIFAIAAATFTGQLDIDLDTTKLQKATAQGVDSFPDAVNALLSGRTYVNVHTLVNAGGEVRGQVGPSVLSVSLSGSQEAPPVNTKTRGLGYVAINGNHTKLFASAALTDLVSGDSAHIHLATPGENGPVLFTLKSAAFVSPINTELADADLAKQPGAGVNSFADAVNALLAGLTYINVHTTANPAGEVRGHVGRATLQVDLSGLQEVPPVTGSGAGFASVEINGEQSGLNVSVSYTNVTGVNAAHIHLGQAGENGPVLFSIAGSGITSPTTKALVPADLTKVISQGINNMGDAVNALLSGHTYVNLHSATNPDGELRGQVGYVALKVTLSGNQEVPPTFSTAKSSGWVLINADHSAIKVALSTSGLAGFTAGHIHHAPAGLSGPFLFALATGSLPGSLDKDLADADLVKANDPTINSFVDAVHNLIAGQMYINLHTTANPAGELRGQIGPVYMAVQLSGAQEIPANDSAGTGDGAITLNATHTAIAVDFSFAALTNIASAHIHLGLPGTNGPIMFNLASAAFTSPFDKVLVEADLLKLAGQGINNMEDAVDALISGQGYINVHTTANPGGELRGQIGQVQMRMVLSGGQEVPANNSNANGDGYISVDTYHTGVAVTTNVTGLSSTISAAHLHLALPGRNGVPILNISGGVINALDAQPIAVADLLKAPTDGINTFADAVLAMLEGRTYFNIHTANFAAGEVRGQIGRVSMRGVLGPDQEVPPVNSAATGVGTAHLDSHHNTVTVTLEHTGIATTITNAHIHVGSVGTNGGVLHNLTTANVIAKTPSIVTLKGFSSTTGDNQGIDQMLSGRTYFNIHTTANAGGELRGQVGAARMTATANGLKEVPPVVTTATGDAKISLDAWQTSIFIIVNHAGLTGVTSAHIHIGTTTTTGAILYNVSTTSFASGLAKELVEADLNKSAVVSIKTMLDGINRILTGNTYLNIHTTANPSGEIRGQLTGE